MRLVLASGNPGKLRELASQLGAAGISVVPRTDFTDQEAPEDGLSFVENALKKARHASAVSGLPAVADDSGLRVTALGGKPGIHSSSYAGDTASDAQNCAKLLEAMSGVPAAERGAAFHCTLVFLRSAHDPAPVIASAEWTGQILSEPRGAEGFGYDPVFQPAGAVCSAAELRPEQKQSMSHRARALELFLPQLCDIAKR